MRQESWDAVVVGSGLAGLTAALSLSPLRTLLITKTDALQSGSTAWAQGGVAFPDGKSDVPSHIRDTLISGAGHGNSKAVETLVNQASDALLWLESHGIRFDRGPDGQYLRAKEGAHSSRRILHLHGDATGAGLSEALTECVKSASNITVKTSAFALKILTEKDAQQNSSVKGLFLLDKDAGLMFAATTRIVLAGGGLGQLFSKTTAPVEATGDTMVLGSLAGVPLEDMEMIQFHPTGLDVGNSKDPVPLLSEALRGEGAILLTADSAEGVIEPLEIDHPLGSLGPRDVVARAIFMRLVRGCPVWLDSRKIENLPSRFPTVTNLTRLAGFNLTEDLLPVIPAVHYSMGGLKTDLHSCTNVIGLFAAGETACTGVHGANRLASNSLLECLVFALEAAKSAKQILQKTNNASDLELAVFQSEWEKERVPKTERVRNLRSSLQEMMFRSAGPVRSGVELDAGLRELEAFERTWESESKTGPHLKEISFEELRYGLETQNLLLLGRKVLIQALNNKKSLGAHFRSDAIYE